MKREKGYAGSGLRKRVSFKCLLGIEFERFWPFEGDAFEISSRILLILNQRF